MYIVATGVHVARTTYFREVLSMSKLWYKQPASEWEEALPLGNGHMGAMIFGNVANERIQLNEEHMWYGGNVDRNNPDALSHLPKIRDLIFEGKISEAEKLMSYALSGCPESMHPYQTFGDLYLNFTHPGTTENITDYVRQLDLKTAIYEERHIIDETAYYREAFINAPENVMAMRFTKEGTGLISMDAVLRRERFFTGTMGLEARNGIYIHGRLGDGGLYYGGLLMAKHKGGSMTVIGERLIIEGANEITLYFKAMTAKEPEFILDTLRNSLQKTMILDYRALKRRHMEDYQTYYKRIDLAINDDEASSKYSKLPTDVRLKALQEGDTSDTSLSKLYFDYGRYLLISCSRPGGLPATLQGLWNKDLTPPWDSKYTVNINLQMNYWPAEICALPECHIPLFTLLEKMLVNGQRTAKIMYGCRGFVCHHNTDAKGDTAPQDVWIPGTFWVMGAAWLSTHIWEHYCYTLNKQFLARYYEILKEAALFFEDFLVEHDGYLVTCPSVSPENTFILPSGEQGANIYGVTMDNQILRDLFTICLKCANILGGEPKEYTDKLQQMLDKLIPTRIGTNGTIMEWPEEYEELEPGHRHISHLYGLHPSDQITMDGTPDLAEAAKKTLERRLSYGGGHTGWSRAWIINHYAKLWDGESAYENLLSLLSSSTYMNLFDKHPPFQIDGNFGATAGIANMIVQSTMERIVLLPALPKAWKSGHLYGVKVKGGLTLDIEWDCNALKSCTFKAAYNIETVIKYKDQIIPLNMKSGEQLTISNK